MIDPLLIFVFVLISFSRCHIATEKGICLYVWICIRLNCGRLCGDLGTKEWFRSDSPLSGIRSGGEALLGSKG